MLNKLLIFCFLACIGISVHAKDIRLNQVVEGFERCSVSDSCENDVLMVYVGGVWDGIQGDSANACIDRLDHKVPVLELANQFRKHWVISEMSLREVLVVIQQYVERYPTLGNRELKSAIKAIQVDSYCVE